LTSVIGEFWLHRKLNKDDLSAHAFPLHFTHSIAFDAGQPPRRSNLDVRPGSGDLLYDRAI
jgi:hypothetical protein